MWPVWGANGKCDETEDWSKETVDAGTYEGWYRSTAADAEGRPMISHRGSSALKFGVAALPSPAPVGGIAELPDVSGSSAPSYIALGGFAAVALAALTAGAWYGRRRWLR